MDFGGLFDTFLPIFENVPVLRAIIAFILVFFLPGFAWTLVFFKQLKVIERTGLSFGLSIALVTLSVLALHLLFDMKINGTNALLTIIVITLIAAGIYALKRFVFNRTKVSNGD